MNWEQLQQQLVKDPPAFQNEFSREIVLPLLLGQDTADLTYWLGKEIARRFPLGTWSDLQQFFTVVNWGQLELTQQKKATTTLKLTGAIVNQRLTNPKNTGFNLEGGFLAQSLQQQLGNLTEAAYEVDKRHQQINFTLKTDPHDPTDDKITNFLKFHAPETDE